MVQPPAAAREEAVGGVAWRWWRRWFEQGSPLVAHFDRNRGGKRTGEREQRARVGGFWAEEVAAKGWLLGDGRMLDAGDLGRQSEAEEREKQGGGREEGTERKDREEAGD
uniref:Uncharacterized protein n=1 Tax=Opuntia streptacantha TaxID=393608 RepID=A0A7C9C9D1_OPUST